MVILSLTSLGSQREASKKWLPLTPHKKGHEVSGELLVECFVSQFRPGAVVSHSETSSPISSRIGSQEDMLHLKKGHRFSLHRRTPSWSKGSAESPGSIGELEPFVEGVSRSKQTQEAVSYSRGNSEDINPLRPQVTGVSPHEGPMSGGQRVVLRGSNLGDSRESVLKVMLADVDCTESLEYFSPSEFSFWLMPPPPPEGLIRNNTCGS